MSKSAEEIMDEHVVLPSDMDITRSQILNAIESYAKSKEADVLEAILDDIDFGYDASMIKGKIESKSYTTVNIERS